MYVLHCDNEAVLHKRTELFQRHFEPLLRRLEQNIRNYDGVAPPELEQYLQVCRWPFRAVEYSFVLDALLHHSPAGGHFLDAGCGVTPLGHAVADLGLRVDACDADRPEFENAGHTTHARRSSGSSGYVEYVDADTAGAACRICRQAFPDRAGSEGV